MWSIAFDAPEAQRSVDTGRPESAWNVVAEEEGSRIRLDPDSKSEQDRLYAVNVRGLFLCSKAAVETMALMIVSVAVALLMAFGVWVGPRLTGHVESIKDDTTGTHAAAPAAGRWRARE